MASAQGDSRTGFGPETAGKTFADNELLGAAAGDDLFVDELLDFSNGYSETEEQLEEPQEMEMGKAKIAAVFQPPVNGSVSGKQDIGSIHEGGLSVQFSQAESLESLEWLSHFVEESFSDYSLAGKFPPGSAENQPETAATLKEQPCFSSPVQTKARTKRARAGVRVWPVFSSSLTDSSTASSSSMSSTTSFPPPYPTPTDDFSFKETPAKKLKRKLGDGGGAVPQPRRCSHCGVTKTPQWRAGPLGSKTLCNACGVRFKSGRLLPEYRPACSPTFSSELHSNSHRKVLEMRRQKELEMDAAGLPPPVQSF